MESFAAITFFSVSNIYFPVTCGCVSIFRSYITLSCSESETCRKNATAVLTPTACILACVTDPGGGALEKNSTGVPMLFFWV